MSLENILRKYAISQGDKIALYEIDNEYGITYKDLYQESFELSKKLSVNKEELFLINKPNSIELVKEILACAFAKRVFFTGLGNPFLTDSQKNSQLDYIKNHFYYKKDGFQIRTSSGTTGQARFFYATEDNRIENAVIPKNRMRLNSQDTILTCGLSLSSGLGDCCLFRSLISGSKLFLDNDYSLEKFFNNLTLYKPTVVMSSAGGITDFYNYKGEFLKLFSSSLSPRVWYSGAGPLCYDHAVAVENLIEGVVINSLCCTESATAHLADITDSSDIRLKTVGKLNHSILAEDGEILLEETKVSELLGKPSEFINGYYPSGDFGAIDDNGYLVITGRKKLLINDGYTDLNPYEIESFLQKLYKDASFICVGVKTDIPSTKEYPCIIINSTSKVDINLIKKSLYENFNFKLKYYYFIDYIPKLKNYKPDRVTLNTQAQNLYTNTSDLLEQYDICLNLKNNYC